MPRYAWSMSEHETRSPAPSAGRDLTAEESLEVEADLWRRVLAAFLLGLDAPPEQATLRPWRGLLGGTGLAVAIVLVVGVVGVASATIAGPGGKPSPSPSVTSQSAAPAAGRPAPTATPGSRP
jgi:hypothetical protein